MISFDPLTAAFDLGKMAIEKIWPDPTKRAIEIRKLEELKQAGDLAQLNATVQLMLGQLKVNEKEARHKSIFVAGWRPFIGWVGGLALAYQFLLYPLLMWVWALCVIKQWIPLELEMPPVLDAGVLFTIVVAMLGIGGMRSYDKRGNVHTDSLK